MTDRPPSSANNDRLLASMMARALMFVMFIGSGVSFALLLAGSSLAGPVCIGSGVIGAIVLLAGGYFVARARSS